MPKSNIDAEIRDRIDAFLGELSDLVRQAALEAVSEALGSESAAAPRRRGPGRPPGSGKKKKKVGRRATKKRGGKRIRRSAADLDAMGDELLDYIRANPGERLEQISAALGSTSKELRRPIVMLLEDKKVRTEGQRRGTMYFAGGGGARKSASKKKRKKAGRKKKR